MKCLYAFQSDLSGCADGALQHQIAFNLHPCHLEKIGLTDALKAMIEKIKKVSNIKFEYSINHIDNLLPKELEINCYRILQELLNNILRHSKATKAWIKISQIKNFISITIRDNGIGFNYEQGKNKNHGFGLSNVSERIEILEGKLEIKSPINEGTSFIIQVPYD